MRTEEAKHEASMQEMTDVIRIKQNGLLLAGGYTNVKIFVTDRIGSGAGLRYKWVNTNLEGTLKLTLVEELI